ncbi:hypothetical protein T492DRAFT_1148279 [Pavlovales sp. CCMP2436]|nr:hypothetical protein T492DRAFT_1148279 [Pavlovales sp. CCMP2436]
MFRLLRAGRAGLLGATLVGLVRSDVASAMPRRDAPPPGAVSAPAHQPRTGFDSSAGGPADSSAGGPAAPVPLAPGDIPTAFQEDADVAGGAARARSHFCAAAGPYRPAASRPQVRRVAATALHGQLCDCPGKRLGTRVDRGRFRVSPVAQVLQKAPLDTIVHSDMIWKVFWIRYD